MTATTTKFDLRIPFRIPLSQPPHYSIPCSFLCTLLHSGSHSHPTGICNVPKNISPNYISAEKPHAHMQHMYSQSGTRHPQQCPPWKVVGSYPIRATLFCYPSYHPLHTHLLFSSLSTSLIVSASALINSSLKPYLWTVSR